MPTRLYRKINSYSIEKGWEFNEAYVLPPTESGSVAQSVAGDWTKLSGGDPVYESTEGPAGGGGSWKFVISNTAGGTTLRNQNASALALVNDREFTAGCWVKFESVPTVNSLTAVRIMAIANIFTAGFGFYLTGTTSTYGGTFAFTSTTGNTVNSGITPNIGQWYFLSVIVNGTSTKYYVDGVETNSVTRTLSTNGSQIFFGSATPPASAGNAEFNICNAFICDDNSVTASDLLEIYNVGISDRVVKYWDGDSWEESYDQKVYNGSTWEQWDDPKYWNGSAWTSF